MGEGGKNHFAEDVFAHAARQVALNLRAHRLNDLVVFDTRWAGSDASHAAEAAIHVLPEAIIERRLTFSGLLDHVNAAARRVHLLAPQHVRGACRQAEAAVNAVVDVFLLWRMVRVKAGRLLRLNFDRVRNRRQMFPTKRPGLRVRLGSKRRLISRISASAFESQPQTSRPALIDSGIRSAITLPPDAFNLERS